MTGGGGLDLMMTFDDRGGTKIAENVMTSYMTAPLIQGKIRQAISNFKIRC